VEPARDLMARLAARGPGPDPAPDHSNGR
jgi:hypothetical protein